VLKVVGVLRSATLFRDMTSRDVVRIAEVQPPSLFYPKDFGSDFMLLFVLLS
jgi:hypothetical protein